jgi:hypothetical protein
MGETLAESRFHTYFAPSDTNPSFTPIGEAQEVYDQVMGKFPV